MRAQAIEHLIALCKSNADTTVVEAAQDGADLCRYFSKRKRLIEGIVHLDRQHPEIAELLKQLPELQIAGVRTLSRMPGGAIEVEEAAE